MVKRVFIDHHHGGLLESLYLLFQDRLGYEVYRPVGMEWYEEGYWNVYPHIETAKQYLMPDFLPSHGYPPLNSGLVDKGDHYEMTWEGRTQRLLTLEQFKNLDFEIVLASMPQHIQPFQKLIGNHQPKAKLIYQVGNQGWDFSHMDGMNVLASVLPQEVDPGVNVIFYHQEFDLNIFHSSPIEPNGNIYSFINTLQETGGYEDFATLEEKTKDIGATWKSYGGICRDGFMTGDCELAAKMREAMLIYNVKPVGDGFGHVIHNAYAIGRPVITRSHHYKDQLPSLLLVPGSFMDLDDFSYDEAREMIFLMMNHPAILEGMSVKAKERFKELVDYEKEGEEIKQWLTLLK